MDICLLGLLCFLRKRSLRRADPFYRGVVRMSVYCECCVLSYSGLCDGLIPCTEVSYECFSVVSVVYCQVQDCATG